MTEKECLHEIKTVHIELDTGQCKFCDRLVGHIAKDKQIAELEQQNKYLQATVAMMRDIVSNCCPDCLMQALDPDAGKKFLEKFKAMESLYGLIVKLAQHRDDSDCSNCDMMKGCAIEIDIQNSVRHALTELAKFEEK